MAKKQFSYKLKIGSWRIYLSNCRLKKARPSEMRSHQKFYKEGIAANKKRRYKLNGGTCDLCGRPVAWDDVQMHHILPYGEFPQYGLNPANMEIACDDCHHAIHRNPYRNLERMEKKARELGFDLREYFSASNNKKCN